MKRGYGMGMALFLFVSLAAGGCEATDLATKETASPLVTSSPGNSSAQGQTVAPETHVTPEPSASAEGEIRARLTGFALADGQHGFVWGLASGNVFRLYRTDDMGQHWKDITPKSGKSSLSIPQSNGTSINVLDAQHIWVASGEREQLPILYTTSNGGSTWETLTFPTDGFLVASARVNQDLGYLLTSADAAMGHSEKSLYVTQDGGRNWKKIMQNGGYIPTKGETPHPIPLAGHANKGMTFKDEKNGWVPLESPDEKLHLYRTKDGGQNWFSIDLPVPKQFAECSLSVRSKVTFFGKGKEEGWFSAVCRKSDSDTLFGYFTQNGGESWNPVAFGYGISSKPISDKAIVFVNSREGWVYDGTNLLRTVDGGKTWASLKDPILIEQLKKFPHAADLQFITPKAGWMLLETDDGKHSLLLSTADGGQSWQIL